MQLVSKMHNLPSLTRPPGNYRYVEGTQISSRETLYPECEPNISSTIRFFDIIPTVHQQTTVPEIVLGTPVNKTVRVDTQLKNQLKKYFNVIYEEFHLQEILG